VIYAMLLVVLVSLVGAYLALDRMIQRLDAAHRAATAAFKQQLDEANNRFAAAAQGALYLTPPQIPPAPDPNAGMELWSDDTGLIQSYFPAEDPDA